MAYFTGILAETDGRYRALDFDLRDAADLDDLVDTMRNLGDPEGDAVAVVEHEDEWFALVRLRSDDEIKVFISDLHAAEASPFAELFTDYLDSRPDEYEVEEDSAEDYRPEGEPETDEDEDDEEEATMLELTPDAEWGGDADIFADRGVPATELVEQVEAHQSDPARVVAHVGEAVGFAEQLEAAR